MRMATLWVVGLPVLAATVTGCPVGQATSSSAANTTSTSSGGLSGGSSTTSGINSNSSQDHSSTLGPSSSARSTSNGTSVATSGSSGGRGLPVVHVVDAVAAQRGSNVFTNGALGELRIPRQAVDNLWLAWGQSFPPADYAVQLRARYGLGDPPFANDGLPMGFRRKDATTVTMDCLLCHGGQVAGVPVVGAPNSLLDLQGLFDDLNTLASQFGYPAPWTQQNRTQAAGANDPMGMGLEFSRAYGPATPVIHTQLGFQDPPPWWNVKFKQRIYTDGSGDARGYRTMMATMLAFGLPFQSLQALAPTFEDIRQYILTLLAPAWPFASPPPADVTAGHALFNLHCADCHGTYGPDGSYPNDVTATTQLGTDATREANFAADEVTWVNNSWFGQDFPMVDTQGYLAPPLVGIWASAPYLHNGSVPDLAALLDATQRPTRWRRAGTSALAYNQDRVGWEYTTVTTSPGTQTVEARKTYDTTLPGLSNAGHTYGAALTAPERLQLLAYLKTL
jgi:mono/diheme cytochrome c family protein